MTDQGKVTELLNECVRKDPMPYRWDEPMERVTLRWMRRAYYLGVNARSEPAECCLHCGAGPADADGELPHFRDCQDA